jgi:hypothetical protein
MHSQSHPSSFPRHSAELELNRSTAIKHTEALGAENSETIGVAWGWEPSEAELSRNFC